MDSSNRFARWPATQSLETISEVERPPSLAETEFDDFPTPVNSSTTLVIPPDALKSSQNVVEEVQQRASITLFRRLVWDGTVPLEVKIVLDEEYTQGSKRDWFSTNSTDLLSRYIQAPRIGYLPLLVPQLKRFLFEVLADVSESGHLILSKLLSTTSPAIWWFEDAEGQFVRWGMPIGTLYDMWNVRSRHFPYSKEEVEFQTMKLFLRCSPTPILAPHFEPLPDEPSPRCKEYHTRRLRDGIAARNLEPPSTPTSDSSSWIRDSVLNDRDADALWESIVQHEFDDFWMTLEPILKPVPKEDSMRSDRRSFYSINRSFAPSIEDPGNYLVCTVPIRLCLPGDISEQYAAPLQEGGSPRTLLHFLYEHIPHLLPEQGELDSGERTAYILIHGAVVPFDAHLAWIGNCLLGPDGWVDVVVGY